MKVISNPNDSMMNKALIYFKISKAFNLTMNLHKISSLSLCWVAHADSTLKQYCFFDVSAWAATYRHMKSHDINAEGNEHLEKITPTLNFGWGALEIYFSLVQ